jgi:hypothetical protein
MIAPGFGFTRHFPKAWNNSVYFQLRKMSCEFKDQARFCPSGEKCGLDNAAIFHLQPGSKRHQQSPQLEQSLAQSTP